MTIPEQIRAARGSTSQRQAARRSGIPLRTLQSWEWGLRRPKAYSLPTILEMLARTRSGPAPRQETDS